MIQIPVEYVLIAVHQGERQAGIKSDADQGIKRGQPIIPGMGNTKEGKGQKCML